MAGHLVIFDDDVEPSAVEEFSRKSLKRRSNGYRTSPVAEHGSDECVHKTKRQNINGVKKSTSVCHSSPSEGYNDDNFTKREKINGVKPSSPTCYVSSSDENDDLSVEIHTTSCGSNGQTMITCSPSIHTHGNKRLHTRIERLTQAVLHQKETLPTKHSQARCVNGLTKSSVSTKKSKVKRKFVISDSVINGSSSVAPTTDCYVGLDCEFVGVGPGKLSALGRCSIVDYDGQVLLDVYVRPEQKITDYRTRWSGIKPCHMEHALAPNEAMPIIRATLKHKVVVGHALFNDFNVMSYHPPPHLVRDTCNIPDVRVLAHLPERGPVGLKTLAYTLLGRRIQTGPHSSVEDARAAMDVYKLVLDSSPVHPTSAPHAPHTDTGDHTGRTHGPRSQALHDKSFLSDEFWPDEF